MATTVGVRANAGSGQKREKTVTVVRQSPAKLHHVYARSRVPALPGTRACDQIFRSATSARRERRTTRTREHVQGIDAATNVADLLQEKGLFRICMHCISHPLRPSHMPCYSGWGSSAVQCSALPPAHYLSWPHTPTTRGILAQCTITHPGRMLMMLYRVFHWAARPTPLVIESRLLSAHFAGAPECDIFRVVHTRITVTAEGIPVFSAGELACHDLCIMGETTTNSLLHLGKQPATCNSAAVFMC